MFGNRILYSASFIFRFDLLNVGSGPVFVLSCNRRFESIGEALKNVCQGEVVRLQPRMYLEVIPHRQSLPFNTRRKIKAFRLKFVMRSFGQSRGLIIDKDNVTLTSVSIGSGQYPHRPSRGRSREPPSSHTHTAPNSPPALLVPSDRCHLDRLLTRLSIPRLPATAPALPHLPYHHTHIHTQP